jgi:hypothetical protein
MLPSKTERKPGDKIKIGNVLGAAPLLGFPAYACLNRYAAGKMTKLFDGIV